MPDRAIFAVLAVKGRLRRAAFSLVETVLALGIVAIAAVSIFALFPVGFRQAGASTLETRGAQLAREVFATLRMSPFEQVPCFGVDLDLSALDEASPPVLLYATLPASGAPSIRATATPDALYTLELRFRKCADVEANAVTLTLSPRSDPAERLCFQSVIARF